MKHELIKGCLEDKIVFKNLMQFYYYDFSEYLKFDVEKDGTFSGYKGLDNYWQDENLKFPYLIKKGANYAGFVLVKKIITNELSYFSITEFFILRKYRNQGIGKSVAKELFDLYKGKWEVHQNERNLPAQLFWHNTISEYTNGHFTKYKQFEKLFQRFENNINLFMTNTVSAEHESCTSIGRKI